MSELILPGSKDYVAPSADTMGALHLPAEAAKAMIKGMGGGAKNEPVKSDFICKSCQEFLFYPEPRVMRLRDGKRYKDLLCLECGYKDSQEFIAVQ